MLIAPRRRAILFWGALAGLGSGACGGSSPLLHPVAPLSEGQTSAGLGMSVTVAKSGAPANEPTTAPASTSPNDSGGASRRFALGAGVAPWVGARVGLGHGHELGLSYTGRALRLDGRHVVESGAFALSLGLGMSAILAHDDRTEQERWALSRSSLGADLPLLAGWRSSGGIVSLYAGPRLGFEHLAGDLTLNSGDAARAASLQHWSLAALVGLTLGFRHVHGALELQSTYHAIRGKAGNLDVRESGVSLRPATSLFITF